MKVSELIKTLKCYLTEHGDDEVVIYVRRHGDLDQWPVAKVDRVKDEATWTPGNHVALLSDDA